MVRDTSLLKVVQFFPEPVATPPSLPYGYAKLQDVLLQPCNNCPQKPGVDGRIQLCYSLLAQTLFLSFQLQVEVRHDPYTALKRPVSGPLQP